MMHTRTSHPTAAVAALLFAFTGATAARADSDVDEMTPSFFFQASGGYSIYKSEMVQSNDTTTTIGYGFGVWAGDGRNVGMLLQREQTAVAFALNGASLSLAWQEVQLRARYGVLHVGLVASASSAWLVTAPTDADGDGYRDLGAEAEDYLNVTTTGLGGNIGLRFPLGRRSLVYLDTIYVTSTAAQEAPVKDAAGTVLNDERPFTLGPRLDLDMGATTKVTKSVLEVRGGFKYRTYQLSVDGESFAEQLNTTYVGLQLGWTF